MLENMKKEHLLERVTTDPKVQGGKPVVGNLSVERVLDILLETVASGETVEELLTQHPGLKREDLLACLAFAGSMSSQALPSEEGTSRRLLPHEWRVEETRINQSYEQDPDTEPAYFDPAVWNEPYE